MHITVWIGILIGIAFGGVLGIICGSLMADEYWRKNWHSFIKGHNSPPAPYEISPPDNNPSENTKTKLNESETKF